MAVLLMNNANSSSTVGFQWKQVPGLVAKTQCNVFDVWAGRSLGTVKGVGYTAKGLAPRDSAFLRCPSASDGCLVAWLPLPARAKMKKHPFRMVGLRRCFRSHRTPKRRVRRGEYDGKR